MSMSCWPALRSSSGAAQRSADEECKAAREPLRVAPLPCAAVTQQLLSAGASDCASCTAVALEVARALVADPDARLPAPAIVLLNGGEETFCQGAAGFVQEGAWRDAPGAFINLESTGSGGPAVIFQATGARAAGWSSQLPSMCIRCWHAQAAEHGPGAAPRDSFGPGVRAGAWPVQAWARSAPYPRGSVVAQVGSCSAQATPCPALELQGRGPRPKQRTARPWLSCQAAVLQDCFALGIIPADSDYHLFSAQQQGRLPGLDVASLLDAASYHTRCDTPERIRPGSLQARKPRPSGLLHATPADRHGTSCCRVPHCRRVSPAPPVSCTPPQPAGQAWESLLQSDRLQQASGKQPLLGPPVLHPGEASCTGSGSWSSAAAAVSTHAAWAGVGREREGCHPGVQCRAGPAPCSQQHRGRSRRAHLL